MPTIQPMSDLCPRCGKPITPPGTLICHACYLDILEGFVDEAATITADDPLYSQGAILDPTIQWVTHTTGTDEPLASTSTYTTTTPTDEQG